MNVVIHTNAERIGLGVFEGELAIREVVQEGSVFKTAEGGISKQYSWSVVNRLPNREPSLTITNVDDRDVVNFQGTIYAERVEALPPEKQVFFHLATAEIDAVIRLLAPSCEAVGIVQMVGTRSVMEFAGMKERPTENTGDTTERVVYPTLAGRNAELLRQVLV